MAPKAADGWNALGVAQYRAGNWTGIAALQKVPGAGTNDSEGSNPTSSPWRTSNWENEDEAAQWYARAVDWMVRNSEGDSCSPPGGGRGLIGPQKVASLRREAWERELAALSDEVRAKPETRRRSPPGPACVRSGRFERRRRLHRLVRSTRTSTGTGSPARVCWRTWATRRAYRQHLRGDAAAVRRRHRQVRSGNGRPWRPCFCRVGPAATCRCCATRRETYMLDPKETWFAMLGASPTTARAG